MSAQRLVRLKAEMTMMTKNPVPGIHCWLKEENSDVILVEMDGPPDSPYQNGVFQLEVTLSDRYPFTPPNIRFLTPVYHPNIDPNGRICLTALKPKPSGSWAVNLNIATVLGAIRILLSEPNLSDPLMTDIAKEYTENFESYRRHAEESTMKHCKKFVASAGSSNNRKKNANPEETKSTGGSESTKSIHKKQTIVKSSEKENNGREEVSSLNQRETKDGACETVTKKRRIN